MKTFISGNLLNQIRINSTPPTGNEPSPKSTTDLLEIAYPSGSITVVTPATAAAALPAGSPPGQSRIHEVNVGTIMPGAP
jgi:hypothetical protein